MVVALVALFVAMGGVGYAALKLPKNSVGRKQIKANAVNSSKVANNSLLAGDFKAGQLPAGPRGPKGDACLPSDPACKGPKGDTGSQGPGAMSFDGQFDINQLPSEVIRINGLSLTVYCHTDVPQGVSVTVQRVDTNADFHAFGIESNDGAAPEVSEVNTAGGEPNHINAFGPTKGQLHVVAKANLPGQPVKWTQFDVHGIYGTKCNYHALVIPPS